MAGRRFVFLDALGESALPARAGDGVGLGLVPVVRLPGTWNTSVQPSSIGNQVSSDRASSGRLRTYGSLPTSSQARRVERVGVGGGDVRERGIRILRAVGELAHRCRVWPSGFATLVITRRVYSIVTSG